MSTSDPVSTPAADVVRAPATRDGFAEEIREAYHEAVEAIFRVGDLLNQAKEELPHGEFGAMVEDDLPFTTRTARRLRAVARDERLRNRTRASDLPSSWTTLYRLSRLDDAEWERIEPHVSPDLTRSEIPDLVARGSQMKIMTEDERGTRERLDDALRELPLLSERNWLKKRLDRVPVSTAVRVAEAFAETPPEKRRKLRRAGEVESPPRGYDAEPEDVQLALPRVAGERREDLLEWADRRTFEDTRIEGARVALNLQALLRWATALCDVTAHGDVVDGLWATRRPRKVAGDARRVADWLTRMAERIEEGEEDS